MLTLAALLLTAGYPTSGLSQTVSILNDDREHGFGFMFKHRGNCYVALPHHVAGADFYPRVNLSTAAPVVSGTGRMLRPFWDGIDLALAVASEAMRDRCTATLDDLAPSREAQTAGRAQLLRIRPDGSEDRTPLTIGDRGYLSFTGSVEAGATEITQGTSGAFAFARGEPIGMAITSDDPTRALFMRSEEVHMNISRFLSQSGGAVVDRTSSATSTSARTGTLPLVLVSSSVPASEPSFAPENMVGNGIFVFEPARRMVFDFRFEPDESHVFKRLGLRAAPQDGYAVPKNIIIQTSNDGSGETFSTLMRREVAPDGSFDTGDIASRYVRRLRLIVLDTWSVGNTAIDQVYAQ